MGRIAARAHPRVLRGVGVGQPVVTVAVERAARPDDVLHPPAVRGDHDGVVREVTLEPQQDVERVEHHLRVKLTGLAQALGQL